MWNQDDYRYNETVKKLKKYLITKYIISFLTSCNFVKLNTNLVIYGPCAIASEAIKQRYKAFYIRVPRLLELYDNMRNSRRSLSQAVQKYAKYDF